MEGGQQVLRLEWMEVEEVAAAGKSAERLVDAMESLASPRKGCRLEYQAYRQATGAKC